MLSRLGLAIIFSISLTGFLSMAFAEEGSNAAYIAGNVPFALIEDVDREAEAWGTCSAIYEIASVFFAESKPAMAEHYKNLSNGATMAVVMSHVTDGLALVEAPEDFDSLWAYSKTLADSIPDTIKNAILADAEMQDDDGSIFIGKMTSTIEICMENLKSQQDYIDSWREMMKSGLLKSPDS